MIQTMARISNQAHPTRSARPGGVARQGLLVLVLGVTGAAAVAAASELPAIVTTAGAAHHVGKVIWVDLVTPDLEVAKRFYGGMFGWTFSDVAGGVGADHSDYSVASLDGHPVGGLVRRDLPPGEQRQPAWLTFISVRDASAAQRRALAHGAKLLSEARNYPRRGRQAVFADPQGAVFAVLAASGGDPPDVLAAPGEWIWSSLLTRDPDVDAAFYQAMFGYEVFALPGDDGAEHLVLSSDKFARASANALPADRPDRHPRWLNYVRVASVDDAAARAVGLGGRVLVEPRVDRRGSRIAILADAAGAPFGVMEWSDTDNQEAAK